MRQVLPSHTFSLIIIASYHSFISLVEAGPRTPSDKERKKRRQKEGKMKRYGVIKRSQLDFWPAA